MTAWTTRKVRAEQLDARSLVDGERLEAEVKAIYRRVARGEAAELHFEVGRGLAEHLGYPSALLDAIPAEALASFAGVGHHLDLAALRPGDAVLDLGSGSGTDVFCAAVLVGASGHVTGVDITEEQLGKAARLRERHGFSQARFVEAHIEELPFEDASFDAVISNGVINLSRAKGRVFAEAARVLRPRREAGGRRHRQRPRTQGTHETRRRAVGSLHRWGDPSPPLPGGARGARPEDRTAPHKRVPLHLTARTRRLQHLRRREHLPGRRKAK